MPELTKEVGRFIGFLIAFAGCAFFMLVLP